MNNIKGGPGAQGAQGTLLKISVLVLGVLAGAALIAAPAGATTWYLTRDSGALPGTLQMVQALSPPEGLSGQTAALDPAECLSWAADQPAAAPLDLQRAGWSGTIEVNKFASTTTATATASRFSASPVTPVPWASEGTTTFPAGSKIGTVATAGAGTFTIGAGARLLFQFCAPSDAAPGYHIKTAGTSLVASPDGSPPYPTPELPALVMTGVGLLLVGLVAARRRVA